MNGINYVFRIILIFFIGVTPISLVCASQVSAQQLLIMGDSLSAGYGVPQDQNWVTLLEQKIKAAKLPIVVVNASVSGDTSAGGLARLPKELERLSPQWVMIELGGNDGLRGLSLKSFKANLNAMVETVKSAGAQPLLVGMKIPPNYGRKYTQAFEQVYTDVANAHKVPLLPFMLEGVAQDPALMQSDRVHPNLDAQPKIAELIWQFIQPHVVDPG